MAWKKSIVAAAVGTGLLAGLIAGVLIAVVGTGGTEAASDSADTQVARIYQLQAAFHEAVTVHDPDDVSQRVADMLALWTEDGALTLGPNTFTGKGEPGTASCAAGAGTLCDFFTNIAPAFQVPLISLAAAYDTEIAVQGNTGNVAFACHLFDLAWDVTGKLAVDATVVKVGSDWLFADALITPLPLDSIPYA